MPPVVVMGILMCVIVGLLTGAWASAAAVASGHGLVIDAIAGIAGAFAACMIFAGQHWPADAIVGIIFIAFMGGLTGLLLLGRAPRSE